MPIFLDLCAVGLLNLGTAVELDNAGLVKSSLSFKFEVDLEEVGGW